MVAVVSARNLWCLEALLLADIYIDFKPFSRVEHSLTYPK